MIDKSTRKQLAERKERVRRRINTKVDPENYEFIPAKKPIDYYDNDIRQRVAVYARVSTDNVQQTSSYELQKKYYEDFVVHHPNWTLVKIYADEGISGTSLAHRDEFNSMIADCRSGKIDMIITKSVSRFARNVVDCISMVRMLAELPSPVGVFFESECIFSLKDDSRWRFRSGHHGSGGVSHPQPEHGNLPADAAGRRSAIDAQTAGVFSRRRWKPGRQPG